MLELLLKMGYTLSSYASFLFKFGAFKPTELFHLRFVFSLNNTEGLSFLKSFF